MHQQVLAKIALKQGKKKLKEKKEEFSYAKIWEESRKRQEEEKDEAKEKIKMQVWQLKNVPVYIKEELIKFIEFGKMRKDVKKNLEIENWPKELKEFMELSL